MGHTSKISLLMALLSYVIQTCCLIWLYLLTKGLLFTFGMIALPLRTLVINLFFLGFLCSSVIMPLLQPLQWHVEYMMRIMFTVLRLLGVL